MYAPSPTARPVPRRRRRRQARRGPLPRLLLSLGLVLAALLLAGQAVGPRPAPSPGPSGTPSVLNSPNTPDTSDISNASASPTGSETPPPVSEADPGPDTTAWNLALVNWQNPLPEDFAAPDLTRLKNGQSVDSRAYPALQAMMDAARAEGLRPLVCSSFRTWGYQENLFRKEVQRWRDRGYSPDDAELEAARWVARPGTSEHHLGLAVDIVDTDNQLLNEEQEKTPVQKWLLEHCWEYGFILRYPSDKSALTGIGYEPWHYRYVGVEAAQEIHAQNLCLEEYLAG